MPASTAAHVLEQAIWGPTPQAVAELQAKGFDQWFRDQMTAPVSAYPDQPLTAATGKINNDISPVQILFLQCALSKPDQLRQRVAFALSEIWVASHVDALLAFFNATTNELGWRTTLRCLPNRISAALSSRVPAMAATTPGAAIIW
jgi:uncharacterized protein (DUF1800 family)